VRLFSGLTGRGLQEREATYTGDARDLPQIEKMLADY
jgi:hypothetical protein